MRNRMEFLQKTKSKNICSNYFTSEHLYDEYKILTYKRYPKSSVHCGICNNQYVKTPYMWNTRKQSKCTNKIKTSSGYREQLVNGKA